MKGECDFVELQKMYLIHRLIIATRSKCSFGNVAGTCTSVYRITCVYHLYQVHPEWKHLDLPGRNLKSKINFTKKIQAKDGNK